MKISLKLVLTVLVTVLSLLLEATQKEDALLWLTLGMHE